MSVEEDKSAPGQLPGEKRLSIGWKASQTLWNGNPRACLPVYLSARYCCSWGSRKRWLWKQVEKGTQHFGYIVFGDLIMSPCFNQEQYFLCQETIQVYDWKIVLFPFFPIFL